MVLETRGVVKRYRGAAAVDGVSLHVRKGEIYGFLGPNGAGKTTTLRLLLGLARPDGGSVAIRGVDPFADPRRAHAGVGFLPESLSFYRTLTGRQTLRFFADVKGVSRERADEALALAELGEAADKRTGAYSRGMTQRLGLAQALLGDPDVLVLDEPTGGLDPLAHRHVKDLLRARHQRGATILFSSHILSEVQELAGRVAILRRGRLVAQDSVEALRERLRVTGEIVFVLARPSDAAIEAVRALAGVTAARLEGARLVVACDAEARMEVTRAADEAAGVVSFETREPSLEDVFLELARDPGA